MLEPLPVSSVFIRAFQGAFVAFEQCLGGGMKASAIPRVIIRGRGGAPYCMAVHRKGAVLRNVLQQQCPDKVGGREWL